MRLRVRRSCPKTAVHVFERRNRASLFPVLRIRARGSFRVPLTLGCAPASPANLLPILGLGLDVSSVTIFLRYTGKGYRHKKVTAVPSTQYLSILCLGYAPSNLLLLRRHGLALCF